MTESTEEPRIIFITCRAADIPSAGAGSDCKGKQAEVVSQISTSEVQTGTGQPTVVIGGGFATTYRCLTCNRRFMIST